MSCAHIFKRRRFWWLYAPRGMRWVCIHCGLMTRTYDVMDFMGQRPLHPHMTVAAPDYNTTRKASK